VWYHTPLIIQAVYERIRLIGRHASEYRSSSTSVEPSHFNLVIYRFKRKTISEFENVLNHKLYSHVVEVAHT